MTNGRTRLAGLLTLSLSVPLAAQERVDDPKEVQPPPPAEQRLQAWVKGQGLFFQNFFQATEGRAEEDVHAFYGEAGASYRLSRSLPVRAYASANTVQYNDDLLDSADGFRIGARGDGRPHAFDVYFDQQMDRPTFDVGDVFDRADVRTFSGQYGYRVTRDWELKAGGELQNQEFDLTPVRDNDYSEIMGAVRYRGWRQFSPEIGFAAGERDVDDPTLSYDQSEVYLQIRSAVSPRLYASVRLRLRERDYSTSATASSNFGRSDDRQQLSGYADYELLDYLTLNLYGSFEDVDSNLEGRDFDTSMLLVGLTLHF
ncbi:MAG: DUF560 domain-containing protein [Acidobacteria bacterium]|nr:DUF560 domain-containing protein [Acidobacteriota bacterium]